jgi:hypothetical protein
VYGVHGYLPAAAAALLRRDALELAGAEHLAYAAGGELENPRVLIDAVEVLLHICSIPAAVISRRFFSVNSVNRGPSMRLPDVHEVAPPLAKIKSTASMPRVGRER